MLQDLPLELMTGNLTLVGGRVTVQRKQIHLAVLAVVCSTITIAFYPLTPASSAAPSTTVVAPNPTLGPTGPLRGAVGGAALGDIGGAIAGYLGLGAAIDAAIGGTVRRVNQAERSANQNRAAKQGAIQRAHNAATKELQSTDHTRAMGACLAARGYSVN